ncbi:MAG: Gfo/Idh/MocA family oxidoreductase, partial [Anaerolineae bacterium]|nr:Gfo/Idh/MocA family oxidoreductase [Anaerolineae bacterium]
MAEERLRWGLVSTARINSHLIPGIQRVRRGELVAVASRDQSRADAYAEEWGIPRAYGSYEKLLEDREVDVAYISLPNALHHDWVIESAQAGKHVLCEKPMALSEEQCRAMIQAADGAGVVLSEAYMYRYHPLTERVRELVDEGRLGEVRLVRLALTYSIEREDDVRLSAGLGGGSLWDIGCYGVSISR